MEIFKNSDASTFVLIHSETVPTSATTGGVYQAAIASVYSLSPSFISVNKAAKVGEVFADVLWSPTEKTPALSQTGLVSQLMNQGFKQSTTSELVDFQLQIVAALGTYSTPLV